MYCKQIVAITDSVNERFSDIWSSPIFKHLVKILYARVWPNTENDIGSFGDIGTTLWLVTEECIMQDREAVD